MSQMAEGPHGRGSLRRGCVSVTVDLGSSLPSCLLPSLAPAGSLTPTCFFLELRKKDPKKLPRCVSQGFLPSIPCIRFPEPLSSHAGVDSGSSLVCLVLLPSSTDGACSLVGGFPWPHQEHPKWVLTQSGATVPTAQPAPAGAGDLVTH